MAPIELGERVALTVCSGGPVVTLDLMPHPASDVDPAQQLRERRASVEAVYLAIEALAPTANPDAVATLVSDALEATPLDELAHLRGGRERIVAQAVEDYRRFAPSEASNATSAAGLVRILLLQNVDLLWWEDVDDFATEADVRAARLLDLRDLKRVGQVHFSFGIASDGLVRRGRDFLVQRVTPSREPRGPGLAFTAIRPEMLGVLNEISRTTTQRAPVGTPPIRVNSIVRTVEHQNHLKSLGFSALSPSAHCRGWAADIEVTWFERFGAAGALREVLLDYLDRGILNVIDEGRAWHICLSPDHAARYAPKA